MKRNELIDDEDIDFGDLLKEEYGIEDDLLIVDYNFELVCNLNKFECGNKFLDEYIYDEEKCDKSEDKLGNTYLYINIKTHDIIGYFTICASAISLRNNLDESREAYEQLEELDRSMLIKYRGALGIKCFAIDKKFQSSYTRSGDDERRYSEMLLDEALSFLKEANEILGANLIVLHSTSCGRGLYVRNGFEFLNYKDRQLYENKKNIKSDEPSQAEIERNDKFILNINKCEIGSYPMITKID